MKILLTGAAGFIGSNLAKDLLAKNTGIIGIDNFDPFYDRTIKQKNLESIISHPNFKFIEGNLTDLNFINSIDLNGISAIVHLAAKAGVRPSIDQPLSYFDVNGTGTLALLELCKKAKIKRFVFASSSSVYGKNPNAPWKEDESELLPISPYAASKVAGEHLGRVYSHLYDIEFVALRFFTVYGPSQRPDLAIHKFFKKIYNGEAIDQYGNGDTLRDYTYIDDILAGINAAITSNKIFSGFNVFNLGNCDEISLTDLIKEIEKVTGRKAKLNYLAEQPGDVRRTCADITKSKRVLNYQPSTPIKEGLKKFNDWYLKENS